MAYGLSFVIPQLKKDRLRGKGPEKLPMLWHWTWDVSRSPGWNTVTGGLFLQLVSGAVIWGHGHESTPRQDQMRWGDAKDWRRGKERKGQTGRKEIFPCERTQRFPCTARMYLSMCVRCLFGQLSFCIKQLKNTKWLRGGSSNAHGVCKTNKLILTGAGHVTGLRLLTFFIPPSMCASC